VLFSSPVTFFLNSQCSSSLWAMVPSCYIELSHSRVMEEMSNPLSCHLSPSFVFNALNFL
jgi:hypothetical protein